MVVSLKAASSFFNHVDVYAVLDLCYDVLRFLKNLTRWRRDCDFERQMRLVCRPMFVGLHNVEMLLVPFSSCDWQNASVLELRSGYEFHRELNVPSPSVMAQCSFHFVDDTYHHKALWLITVSELIVPFFASFFA